MEHNIFENKHINTSNQDNIEQRITLMLEDVLKGDSSDEELKARINNDNLKQSSENKKPLVCLYNIPVSEDIYVIRDPSVVNAFEINNSKRVVKKSNTLEIKINSTSDYIPKDSHNNNLKLNPNNNSQHHQKQNQQKINQNLNFSNNFNNNTLNFNGMGNINLSPNMEKRKDKNLLNYKNLGINANYLNDKNFNNGNINNFTNLPIPAISNKNSMKIPV